MNGIDLVNTAIFIGASLVVLGIFSSLIATRVGAPLLLVFLLVGMLAGEDGPGGIAFDNYRITYLVGSVALAVILFDGGLRTRLSVFRGVLGPSMTLATVGVLVTASITGLAAFTLIDFAPAEALLLGSIVASTDAAAVFFLLRTGGLRLQSRVGSTLEIESGTNDPVAMLMAVILTEFIVAGHGISSWDLALFVIEEVAIGAALGVAGGFALVAVLNNIPMPGGLHPLFAVASAILTYGLASISGGSGLLAVFLAGLVVANRPTRAYPSIVGFHDAATWLCQIVMFLVLGLLVVPSTLLDYAWPGVLITLVLTFIARPVAVWLSLTPFGYSRNEKLFVSWVGLRGAVSIFLAAIPTLAGVPHAAPYFNIAFFVVLLSLLFQGSTLTTAARRLGLALRQHLPASSRIEIDIPGQTEQEIVGYPVTAESVILGLSRMPTWARLIMVVRRGHVLDVAEAGHLQPGDYSYFLVARPRVPRLDSLFRTSRDVARRLGMLFGELPIRGETRMAEVESFYGLAFGAHQPEEALGDWMAARLGGKPVLDATVPVQGGQLVVRRLETGRIASVGLQLEELLQVEPDEKLLARLEEEADELHGLRRWLAGLRRRRA